MKRKLLLMALAATALLASCSKDQLPEGGDNALHGQIAVKGVGAGSMIDTRIPVTGSSLNGQKADVYAANEDLNTKTGDLSTTFTNVYARGSMTFDDSGYVGYSSENFGGLNGGNKALPFDRSTLYLYGFYPQGWKRAKEGADAYEKLSYTYDGKTDVMSSWLTSADNVKVAYDNPGVAPEEATLVFNHLLTRYNITVQAQTDAAVAAWGRVKSVKIKTTTVKNRVALIKNGSTDMSFGYDNDGTNTTPTSFYQMTGTPAAPVYGEAKFGATDYAGSLGMTKNETNVCYTMVEPVEVDADAMTPELTLEVVTIIADGTETTTEVPVTLLQDDFDSANHYSTRGYSISLALNFRAGVIQAIAEVEEWKEYGAQNIDVDGSTSVGGFRVGDIVDDAVVSKVNSPRDYVLTKEVASDEVAWALSETYVIGSQAQSFIDGQANSQAIRAYYEAEYSAGRINMSFESAFPAAAKCYNYTGTSGTDAPGTWYLPAAKELEAAYLALKEADYSYGFGQKNVTSTESVTDSKSCWSLVYSGNVNTFELMEVPKTYTMKVNCMKHVKQDPQSPIPTRISETKEGGIVYQVTDGENYKIMSLDEGSLFVISSRSSNPSGVAETQNEDDGRIALAGLKAYAAGQGVNYALTYPASAWCESKGDGWYMPARNEWVEIYEVWSKNAAFKTALGENGTPLQSGKYPSSTWVSQPDAIIMTYSFPEGSSSQHQFMSDNELFPIRCIKRVSLNTPPVLGEMKDGGVVYSVNLTDAKDYRVMSLDEMPGRGLFGPTDIETLNEDDGRVNIQARKTYATAQGKDFAMTYPIEAFCEAKGNGWYLPAKNELVEMVNAYNVDKAKMESTIETNGGTVMSGNPLCSSTAKDLGASSFSYFVCSSGGNGSWQASSFGSARCIKRGK